MTVVTRASAPTNGHRRPVVVAVSRADLVGRWMDVQDLTVRAIEANGASLEQVLRLPPGPWRDELQRAHHFAHDQLIEVLAAARMAAGVYEGLRPEPPA